ncbi:hypothetical protein F8388_011922 [Cannabis sativa]|uniref:Uncharacterized protein n=1 Tax=Cannabis sativa TaxID=3483 RepID=A0A7J6GFH1_CANSA|nr:hypothetical protein G4B88_024969 [Cannabis sativa]KAF4381000.1 hypothetical protein F8388_011922 [Cannabis sativa]
MHMSLANLSKLPKLIENHSFIGALDMVRRLSEESLSGIKEATLKCSSIPKGYFAVYDGEDQKKRHVVPLSYLNEPSFQDLLSMAEQEFGYEHPMGGLTIPCSEDIFIDIILS